MGPDLKLLLDTSTLIWIMGRPERVSRSATAALEQLPVTDRHALQAGGYAIAHADPFDRMIAAQAEIEQMTVLASDRAFDLFPVSRRW